MLQLSLNDFIEIIDRGQGDYKRYINKKGYEKIINLYIEDKGPIKLIDPFLSSNDLILKYETLSEIVDELVDNKYDKLALLLIRISKLKIEQDIDFIIDFLEFLSIVSTARMKKGKETMLFIAR